MVRLFAIRAYRRHRSLAFFQAIVHFQFFLHINPPKQNVDDLHLILFSTMILALMAGGTIWIMYNLAIRMMF